MKGKDIHKSLPDYFAKTKEIVVRQLNPVLYFVQTRCVLDPAGYIPKSEFETALEDYLRSCNKMNHYKDRYKQLEPKGIKYDGKTRRNKVYVVTGLAWKPEDVYPSL